MCQVKIIKKLLLCMSIVLCLLYTALAYSHADEHEHDSMNSHLDQTI